MKTIEKIKPAIDGGTPTKSKPFPKWPYGNEREIELLTEVINSHNWWRMSGTKVKEFEKLFAEYHNVKHCLGVTNGTTAIELLLASMNIGAGDEVIVPAFTFVSTATAPFYCNAKAIPVDVDPETFCIDPTAFENAISEKTKAVIPVYMAGCIPDMDNICDIAKRHNIKVIEDAAHAHGGEWKGRKIGSFGDAAIVSFQNGKIMTCGEGGAILTNDDEIYRKSFLIHGVGRPENDRLYKHLELGSNYRMNELQAAVLIGQLERLESQTLKREKNAGYLDQMMCKINGIKPQKYANDITVNTHYMYMFYYDSEFFNGLSRNDFVEYLNSEGIPAYIAYPVVSNTDFFKHNNFRGHVQEKIDITQFYLPNANKISDEVVWLPHYTLLGDTLDLEDIANAVIKIQNAQYS